MAASIIFLTALAQDRAVVRGLSAGGDGPDPGEARTADPLEEVALHVRGNSLAGVADHHLCELPTLTDGDTDRAFRGVPGRVGQQVDQHLSHALPVHQHLGVRPAACELEDIAAE